MHKYTGNEDTPEAIYSRYTIIKEIGHGAYGTVYLAEDHKTQERYDFGSNMIDRCAIKKIDDVFRTKTDAKRTLREITILRQCRHPNIAKLKYISKPNVRCRDVLLPPDEENYRQLWIVQVDSMYSM